MPRNAPTKVACWRCHQRRVKCDRSEGVPCSQCRVARSNCEPILSRRGRHRKLPVADVLTTSTQSVSPNLRGSSTIRASGPTHSRFTGFVGSRQEGHEKLRTRLTDTESSLTSPLPALRSCGKTPYVADSSNINYLIREFGLPYQNTTDAPSIEEYLHRAMLERLDQPTIQYIEGRRSFTVGRLKNEGAFDLPPKEISSALLNVFFQHPFPSLPIIERSDFMKSIETGTVSHLLLNAIYMVATIYCPDSIIYEAGFVSRFIASLTFYHRAKDIYDAGYETDAIAVIQGTFLLAHWWSDPLEQKDPWYWLGVTTGMAQALGMHRLKSYSHLQLSHRRLWRRLWWIVYAADINLSMGLDRVPHVRDDFCEISILTEDDFEESPALNFHDSFGGTVNEQVLFVIHYVQLARTVNIRHPFQAYEGTTPSPNNFLERISSWSLLLPSELRFSSSSRSVWAILTQLTYDQYQLLFCRKMPDAAQNMGPGSPIFEICTRLFRMLEDLVTSGTLFSVAGHVLPAVMSSLCFHIANISRGDPQVRSSSEHRARFCLLILKDLQASWPIIASVYPFFTSIFRRQSGLSFSECEKSESVCSQPIQRIDDTGCCSEDVVHTAEAGAWMYERFLHDENSAVINSAFPFTSLFEDVFLTTPLNDSTP
ncbi:fungal-specific transcription factor domain-containing protein [Talaromyces proteolyticus]|uniref:Fungal-specific transcription factor domain-containing protein n=1 Tax=Talaromyces proteolyticus TaxID=1131652 RepID=A0AAD4KGI3_9EURO|nr:fungal-specific transcription factor domain-containing protein [Talaromyces proteolyticus]KAH8690573.1 fungal-specific transcription factor domain-containing protein [Talaromyces proteolyticus]